VAWPAGLYTGLKLSRFHPPLAHVITSNVLGPPEEIYCAGARIVGLHLLAPLCEGANLNITAVSYGDTFAVGIVGCPDNIEDVTSIARSIEDVAAELKKLPTKRPARAQDSLANHQPLARSPPP
jgi:diacylglycerol O-acyltransferase / wax synthase